MTMHLVLPPFVAVGNIGFINDHGVFLCWGVLIIEDCMSRLSRTGLSIQGSCCGCESDQVCLLNLLRRWLDQPQRSLRERRGGTSPRKSNGWWGVVGVLARCVVTNLGSFCSVLLGGGKLWLHHVAGRQAECSGTAPAPHSAESCTETSGCGNWSAGRPRPKGGGSGFGASGVAEG